MTSFFAWMQQYVADSFLLSPRAQVLGLVAFVLAVYNFTFCKDRKFIIMTAIISVIFGVHFSLLGLMTAGVINLFDAIKNIIALRYEKNIYRVIGLTVAYMVIGVLTYDGLLSLIPTVCAIFSTYLVFYVRGVRLNLGFMVIVGLYMIYNYMGNSLGGFSTDVFLLCFGSVGIWRQLRQSRRLSS